MIIEQQVEGPKTEERMDNIICELVFKSWQREGAGADGDDLDDAKVAGGTDRETPSSLYSSRTKPYILSHLANSMTWTCLEIKYTV